MIIAHMTGEPFKRYMVDIADEELFDHFAPGRKRNNFIFGAQAIRGRGVLDEQYRYLSSTDVVKVTRRRD